MSFKNKVVVITGCSKGIGLETLKSFYNQGANIYACVRKKNRELIEEIKDLNKKSKNKIILKTFNLESEIETKKVALEIIKKSPKIDILVNNAATIYTGLLQMTSLVTFRKLFEVNFFNQVLLTQIILKSIIRNKKGNIIFISSSSATDGNIGRSAYASTKGAINSLAKVLSQELGNLNIRVNTIAPGLIDTDMATNNTPKKFLEDYINSSSLKRIGKPEEIANVILSVCADSNSYLNGQVIRIDGGQ